MCFKNKASGKTFANQCLEDAESLSYFGEMLLKTYLLHKREVNNEIQCTALLDIIKAVGTANDEAANSFLFTVSRRSQELFRAEKCTMYVVDKPREIRGAPRRTVEGSSCPWAVGLLGWSPRLARL